nr:g-type lectin s-receptor-like serine/threonine-protein kinase [Quercus suber]
MDIFAFVVLSSNLLILFFVFSDAADSITKSKFLSDIEKPTLVSKDGGFVLGFFSPSNSTNCYLRIWYNNITVKTVVWVANRLKLISDSSGVLMLNSSVVMPDLKSTQDYSFTYVYNKDEVYFKFDMIQEYVITRAVLNQSHDIEKTTLVSKDGGFVLGFFSPGNSTNRYLGIWYNNITVKTVVWAANRLNPISDSSSVLMLNSSGSLVLLSQNTIVAWLANSTKEARSPVVELLDSVNLVLREENEGNPGRYLWQSFNYPSDTWLSGMKLDGT